MQSPNTGKEMKQLWSRQRMDYQGKSYDYIYVYFLCEDTGDEFTTDDLDELHLKQVYDQYEEETKDR